MKYILANVPGFRHINPTLPVVEELVAQGEEVVYYVPDAFKEAVESVGATFHPYELDPETGSLHEQSYPCNDPEHSSPAASNAHESNDERCS